MLLTKTPLGLLIRAVMQNRNMASCMGVRTGRVNMLTFAFGSGLAGLGGRIPFPDRQRRPQHGPGPHCECFHDRGRGRRGQHRGHGLFRDWCGHGRPGPATSHRIARDRKNRHARFDHPVFAMETRRIIRHSLPKPGLNHATYRNQARSVERSCRCVRHDHCACRGLNATPPGQFPARQQFHDQSLRQISLLRGCWRSAWICSGVTPGLLSLGQALFFTLGGYMMGMYLMRMIGDLGQYHKPIPDFLIFLGWSTLPTFWKPFSSFPFALLMVLLLPGTPRARLWLSWRFAPASAAFIFRS